MSALVSETREIAVPMSMTAERPTSSRTGGMSSANSTPPGAATAIRMRKQTRTARLLIRMTLLLLPHDFGGTFVSADDFDGGCFGGGVAAGGRLCHPTARQRLLPW